MTSVGVIGLGDMGSGLAALYGAHQTGVLDTADFEAEQAYHRGRLALLTRYLHGTGTVCGLEVEIEILGQMRKARLLDAPLFDANGDRMRG